MIKHCNGLQNRMEMYKDIQDAMLAIMHAEPKQVVCLDDLTIESFHAKDIELSVQPMCDGLDIALAPLGSLGKTKRELKKISLRVEGHVHILSPTGFRAVEFSDQIHNDVSNTEFHGFDVEFLIEHETFIMH
jgi:hypothetical protein